MRTRYYATHKLAVRAMYRAIYKLNRQGNALPLAYAINQCKRGFYLTQLHQRKG